MKTITWEEYVKLSFTDPDECYHFTGVVHDPRDHSTFYLVDGKTHREDGPADIDLNTIEYTNNDVLHRLGGPAIIYWDRNIKFYYLFGEEVTKEEHDFYCDLLKLKGLK